MSLWEKLRFSSKFHLVDKLNTRTRPSSGGETEPKRSRTSSSMGPQSQGSDARVNVDLNSLDEVEEDLPSFEEPSFQERPIGRDASKRASHGEGSSGKRAGKGKGKSILGKYEKTFEGITLKLDKLFDQNSKKLDLKERKCLALEQKNDYKILMSDFSHLGEPERSIMEEKKEELRAKYRKN